MGYDDFGDREATLENLGPVIPGYVAEARVHRNDFESAMTAAYVRAIEFETRYWVTRDGERGWYVCPASDKSPRTDGL